MPVNFRRICNLSAKFQAHILNRTRPYQFDYVSCTCHLFIQFSFYIVEIHTLQWHIPCAYSPGNRIGNRWIRIILVWHFFGLRVRGLLVHFVYCVGACNFFSANCFIVEKNGGEVLHFCGPCNKITFMADTKRYIWRAHCPAYSLVALREFLSILQWPTRSCFLPSTLCFGSASKGHSNLVKIPFLKWNLKVRSCLALLQRRSHKRMETLAQMTKACLAILCF